MLCRRWSLRTSGTSLPSLLPLCCYGGGDTLSGACQVSRRWCASDSEEAPPVFREARNRFDGRERHSPPSAGASVWSRDDASDSGSNRRSSISQSPLVPPEMVDATGYSHAEREASTERTTNDCKAASSSGTTSGSSSSASESSPPLDEPLAARLTNVPSDTPYRVTWYQPGLVSPPRRFVYWAYRHLRLLPPEWREYYRRMLRQEVKACRFVAQTWDAFMMVVDGYRKGKWILAKYGVPIDESLIPSPYNNFWEQTTHEERVWAHRRSSQMKDLQALQRDGDDIEYGAVTFDRRHATLTTLQQSQGGMQAGTPVHACDMAAPSEADIHMSDMEEEMSSMLMSSIEDDKLWNPVLKARLHTATTREENKLLEFEDDDEEDDSDGNVAGSGEGRSGDGSNAPASQPNIRPSFVARGFDSAM